MSYCKKQRTRELGLKKLSSECGIVIRYYRSTVIPSNNKIQGIICLLNEGHKNEYVKQLKDLDRSPSKILKLLQDGIRYLLKFLSLMSIFSTNIWERSEG